jgi:hypothetical protein
MGIMSMIKRFLVLLAAAVMAAGLFGCEREGPAERAGERIDETTERGRDRVEDTFERQGPAERTGERMDRAVDD